MQPTLFRSHALARTVRGSVALGLSLLAAACTTTPTSETPAPTNFAINRQLQLQAGAHWNAIANNAAETLVASLRTGKDCKVMDCSGRMFVRPPKENTPFAQAIHTQMITALVNRGIQIKRSPVGAQEIEVDIQVVKFSPGRKEGVFVSAAMLTAGVWALQGSWMLTSPHGIATSVLAGGAFDATRWAASEFASGPVPQHEIFLTVSAVSGDNYIGRVTNVYYVADSDQSLYVPPPPSLLPPPPPLVPIRGGY